MDFVILWFLGFGLCFQDISEVWIFACVEFAGAFAREIKMLALVADGAHLDFLKMLSIAAVCRIAVAGSFAGGGH